MASARQTVISGSRSVGQIKQDPVKQHHHFESKFKLCKSRVVSVLLCGCETWTLLADWEKDPVSYLGHKKTNDWLQGKIKILVGTQDSLVMATVRRRKLAWSQHITRHDNFSKPSFRAHFGGWAMKQSAEKMLDRQCQRVDVPAHCGQPQKKNKVEGDLCGSVHYVPRLSRSVEDLTWLDLITGAEYQRF